MKRLWMAIRLLRHADDAGSRLRLAGYFVRNAVDRTVGRLLGRVGPRRSPLEFRLGGIAWRIDSGSSQLGGVHDVWAAHEYDAFDGFVAPQGGTVVDIGANVGAYSMWQWTNMGRAGTVLAVEASPSTLAVLRGNVDGNAGGDGIEVLETAVWDASGTVEFSVSERSSSTSGVSATLDLGLIRDPSTVAVRAMTLDEVLRHPLVAERTIDVLKLDVEGAELQVLTAASADSLARIARMVIEADQRTWEPVRSLLERSGFEFVGRHRMVGYFVRVPE